VKKIDKHQTKLQQLDYDFKSKENHAIEFLQKHEPPEGYMGCFSGGKDSVVIYKLAELASVKVEWYYSLMHDPPELIQFVKQFKNVKIIRPEFSFWSGIVNMFPPHRKARWRCTHIKEKPGKR